MKANCVLLLVMHCSRFKAKKHVQIDKLQLQLSWSSLHHGSGFIVGYILSRTQLQNTERMLQNIKVNTCMRPIASGIQSDSKAMFQAWGPSPLRLNVQGFFPSQNLLLFSVLFCDLLIASYLWCCYVFSLKVNVWFRIFHEFSLKTNKN